MKYSQLILIVCAALLTVLIIFLDYEAATSLEVLNYMKAYNNKPQVVTLPSIWNWSHVLSYGYQALVLAVFWFMAFKKPPETQACQCQKRL